VKKIFQQLAFPRVPHFRARSTDIGHGEEVERHEPALGPDALGEGAHDLGVADILLLCGRGHAEVVFHEPCDEQRIVAAQGMCAGEPHRVDGAELRMVAAAPFCDIVEEPAQIENFGPLEPAHQPAAQRELVRELGHGEAP
jgi:hypothetical protein